jgi:hypothetical protein
VGNYYFEIRTVDDGDIIDTKGFVQAESFRDATEKIISDFGELYTEKLILEYINDCRVITVDDIKDYTTSRDFS